MRAPGKAMLAVCLVAATLGFSTSASSQAPAPTVFSWGGDGDGQLGNGTNSGATHVAQNVPIADPLDVSAAGRHFLVLDADGNVYASGSNDFGQLCLGDTADRTTPVRITGLPPIAKVETSFYNSYFLTQDGGIFGCGSNTTDQMTAKAPDRATTPFETDIPSVAADIAAAEGYLLYADTGGRLYQTGSSPQDVSSSFIEIATSSRVVEVEAGDSAFYGAHLNSEVSGWGFDTEGQRCDGPGGGGGSSSTVTLAGKPFRLFPDRDNASERMAAGPKHVLFVGENGTVSGCGYNKTGQLGTGNERSQESPTAMKDVTGATSIDTSGAHTVIARGCKDAMATGDNLHGQIGTDPAMKKKSLTPLSVGLYESADVAASSENSYAIADAGCADLEVKKTAPDAIDPGTKESRPTFEYTIVVTNKGPGVADVRLADKLDERIALRSFDGPGVCGMASAPRHPSEDHIGRDPNDPTDYYALCRYTGLLPGESMTLKIKVQPTGYCVTDGSPGGLTCYEDTREGYRYENQVIVWSTTPDPDEKNNADRTTTFACSKDKGTAKGDTLRGTAAKDVVCGGGGADKMDGGGGDDTVLGEAGNDVLKGGGGADVLVGGPGKDLILGGAGADVMVGEVGDVCRPAGPTSKKVPCWEKVP